MYTKNQFQDVTPKREYSKTIFNYRGYKITIEQDNDPESPREWDNAGTMVCSHRRYSLGDIQLKEDRADNWTEARAYYFQEKYVTGLKLSNQYQEEGHMNEKDVAAVTRWIDNNIIYLPLYLYDHSGITMNTTGFTCGWDSGTVGFIYITKEQARKEWGIKKFTKKELDRVCTYLKGEVETYDQYLTGEVYGYTIEAPDGEDIGSCWGFFGSDHFTNGILTDHAGPEIDYHIKSKVRTHLDRLKSWIKNKVPVIYRQPLQLA